MHRHGAKLEPNIVVFYVDKVLRLPPEIFDVIIFLTEIQIRDKEQCREIQRSTEKCGHEAKIKVVLQSCECKKGEERTVWQRHGQRNWASA